MKYLFNSIHEFISPEIIYTTSLTLKEDNSNVLSAIQSSVASILDVIIEKRKDKKLEYIIKHMGEFNILLNATKIYNTTFTEQNLNSNFFNYLLNNKKDLFINIIAKSSNISENSSRDIIYKTSVLISGFLGEKLISGIQFSRLLNQLEEERKDFSLYIPLEMIKITENNVFKPYLLYKSWLSMI
ncbi:hypothetical protein [Apibacter sp. HY039]|uniref:hypothetical protein n=1 Tax=Apibacter sp. HY039 TaxID=2501476 RepID=UPI000FEBDF66|nr:hypothetical protein [Apibacter sp. HY039]